MTKAEAFIDASPLWRAEPELDYKGITLRSNKEYTVRVYSRTENGEATHLLKCDSYYGDSKLYCWSAKLGNFLYDSNVEYDYDIALMHLV